MAQQTLQATLTGTRPLLMHNGQLADPTNEFTREVKAAKRKTDADLLELRKLEWMGGLYLDPKGVIGISEDALLGALISGAAAAKKGKQVKAGVMGAAAFFPLLYDGPKDLLQLYNTPGFCDYRRVVIKRSSIMRARPRFNAWSVRVALLIETSVLNVSEVQIALELAGRSVGLGDFRPRFGRFNVSFA